MATARKLPDGVRLRHGKTCRSREAGPCSCTPSYEAFVALGERGVRKRKSFATLAEAKAWRARGVVAAADGLLRPSTTTTVREVAEETIDGIERGIVRNRSGAIYKPSVLRGYETALRLRVLPAIGARKLSDVSRRDVQRDRKSVV